MGNQFFEEAPAAPAPTASGAQDKIRKAARQLAYDTRYKVKQSFGKGQKTDPASMQRAYMQQLGKSSSPGPVKALAKKMLFGEEYIGDVKELVNETVVKALLKVFVEGVEEVVEDPEYIKQLFEKEGERKYKIRVSDPKNQTSYVRYATREKISQLRAKGLKVEMTSYGEPYEGEKKSGKQTAAALGGKDYDGDGKVESGAKEHAGSVHNAIQRKKGGTPDGKDTSNVKEDFIGEEGKDQNTEKLDIRKKIKNKVNIFPDSKVQEAIQVQNTSQQPTQQQTQKPQNTSAINQVLMAKRNADAAQQKLALTQKTAASKGVNLTSLSSSYQPEGENLDEKITAKTDMGTAIKDFQSSKSSQLAGRSKESRRDAAIAAVLTARRGGKKLGEETSNEKTKINVEDPRSIPTKVNLLKNKLRAMGAKDPIVMMAAEETDADRAMAVVRANLVKKSGEASILGSAKQKEKQAAQAAQPQPKRVNKKPTHSGWDDPQYKLD